MRRLQWVPTAGAAKGRTPGNSEIRDELLGGCKHWKIRNAERTSWGRLIKPACQGNYLTGRQPEEGEKTAHSSPRTHNWVMELCNPLKL